MLYFFETSRDKKLTLFCAEFTGGSFFQSGKISSFKTRENLKSPLPFMNSNNSITRTPHSFPLFYKNPSPTTIEHRRVFHTVWLFIHQNRKGASTYILKDFRKRFKSINELKPSLYKLSFVNATFEVLNFAGVKFREFHEFDQKL